jgi:aerobic carbon-monoxide dehydrogenase large subunit
MGQFGIGQPVPREEDPYLLRGAGRYVEDVRALGQARAFVLRSPHAHALIRAIDVSAARTAPGVLLVLTGTDAAVLALGRQSPRVPRKRRDGSPGFVSPQPQLARERVRYVGECVAFVVAETLDQAKDAAELIAVDYAPLPAVVATDRAVAPGAPAVWPECPDNQAWFHELGNKAAVDAAFAKADHIVRHRMIINRITTNSLEPRGCLAEYDTHDDRYVIRCTVQAPHRTRGIFASQIFKVPETKVRVICDNMGGGFGMKGALYNEYPLTALAAKLLGRPVKWISERSEGLVSDEQARDNVTDAELALDKDGRFLALRVKTLANIGAYHTSDRAAGPPLVNLGVLAGTYTTPAIHVEVSGVMTHTMLTGHYRGAGRPEAAYVIETMVDRAAQKLGIDPVELRRRNTIPASAMPYKTGLVYHYDSGDFAKNLDDALGLADYAGFARRREDAGRRGKLLGIGVSNTIEASSGGMIEHAQLRFDPGGTLTLLMGTHDHGQGHATTFKQVLSDKLGLDPDVIRFKNGDTDQITIGTGTFGSRSAVCGGSAVVLAVDKIIAKGKRIAAHLLETAENDLVFADGKFTVAGTDRAIALQDVARNAYAAGKLPRSIEPGLDESGTYDGGPPTFPNGCHVCEVEIDEATGAVAVVRYVAVDEVGRAINPLLLEGQVHGGIAQGVGQALMEDVTYDPDSGQVMAGSFMDYAMPRARDLCAITMETNEVPTKTNPLGVKGAGEAGTVGALPAVMSAINNALAQRGAPYVQMPATAEKVWRALRAAR